MGTFSWCDCCNYKKYIKVHSKAFVLVPKEYHDKYGKIISESSYDGYGTFGSYDIYDLVAEWNRKYIQQPEKYFKKPERYKYMGLWDFEKDDLRKNGVTEEEIRKIDEEKRDKNYNRAINYYNYGINMMNDYIKGLSDGKMIEKYGDEYKRTVGINISCDDSFNSTLKFPIKITYDQNAIYEEVPYSPIDEGQGR